MFIENIMKRCRVMLRNRPDMGESAMVQVVETPPSVFTTDSHASPLWGLVFKNLILIIITFGIYSKMNKRKF